VSSEGESSTPAAVNLIDVGAVGSLPSPWKENTRHIGRLLKFEPRETPSKYENIIALDTALWESSGVKDFYVYKGSRGEGSSLFRQNIEYVRENFEWLKNRGPSHLAETWFERSQPERTVKVHCRTLDDVLSEIEEHFHFLKVDAQGAEYQVLRGAEKFLSSDCLGMHLELFVIPLYRGITLLPEVEKYLEGFGFYLEKKYPAHGTFDSQHDCLFLRKTVPGESGAVFELIREIYRWQGTMELYQTGVKAFNRGDHGRGKRSFLEVVRSGISDVDILAGAWFFLGEIAGEEKETGWEDYFKKSLDLLLEQQEKTELRMYRIASIYKRLSRFQQALEWFDAVLKNSTNQNTLSAAYFHRGEIFYLEKEYGKARRAFEKSLELNPAHKRSNDYLRRLK
jgi:FkbM family methyltransferase